VGWGGDNARGSRPHKGGFAKKIGIGSIGSMVKGGGSAGSVHATFHHHARREQDKTNQGSMHRRTKNCSMPVGA